MDGPGLVRTGRIVVRMPSAWQSEGKRRASLDRAKKAGIVGPIMKNNVVFIRQHHTQLCICLGRGR
jgi:hypothetical protein